MIDQEHIANRAKELAADMLRNVEGQDPNMIMTALVWATAGTVATYCDPMNQDDVMANFALQMKNCVEAIERGKLRSIS